MEVSVAVLVKVVLVVCGRKEWSSKGCGEGVAEVRRLRGLGTGGGGRVERGEGVGGRGAKEGGPGGGLEVNEERNSPDPPNE